MLLTALILIRLFNVIISDTSSVSPVGNSLQNAIQNIPQYTQNSDVSDDISMFQRLSIALQDILDGESNGISQDFDGGNGHGIMTNNGNKASQISYLPPLSQVSPLEEKGSPQSHSGRNIITNNLQINDREKLGHNLQKSSHSVEKPVQNTFQNNEPGNFAEPIIPRKKPFKSTFTNINQNGGLLNKKKSISDGSIHKGTHVGNETPKDSHSNQIGRSLLAIPGDIVWRFDQPKVPSDIFASDCCKETDKNVNKLSSHTEHSDMITTVDSQNKEDSKEKTGDDQSMSKALSLAIDSVYDRLLPSKHPCCEELYPVYKPTITELVTEIKEHPKSSAENRECRELFAMLWRDLKECEKINMHTTRQFINQLNIFDKSERKYSKDQSKNLMKSGARRAKRLYLRNALRSRAKMYSISKGQDKTNDKPWWRYGGKIIQYPRWRYGGEVTQYPRWWYGGKVYNRPRRWYGGKRRQYPAYLGYWNNFGPRGYYQRQRPWMFGKAPYTSSQIGFECVH